MQGEATKPLPGADDVGLGTRAAGDVETAARRLVELALERPQCDDAGGVLVDVVVAGARCVVTAAPRLRTVRAPAVSTDFTLSPREREIARMVAAGYTNKEIAAVLEISSWTVSTHLRRIFGKLDVSTRAAMVARILTRP